MMVGGDDWAAGTSQHPNLTQAAQLAEIPFSLAVLPICDGRKRHFVYILDASALRPLKAIRNNEDRERGGMCLYFRYLQDPLDFLQHSLIL